MKTETNLSSDAIGLWPQAIIFMHDLRVHNYSFKFLHNTGMYVSFLADHCVVFVVGIIGVPKLAIRAKLELQEFMSKLSFMSNVVTYVEVCRHCS